MLFVTNRAINEPLELEVGRKITFSKENNQAGQAIFFCRRNDTSDYTEIGSINLLEELRNSPAEQILVFIHGFNCRPEPSVFSSAEILQSLFDAAKPNLVQVLPLIWPCNDQFGVVRDYYDDEVAADASAFAFARLLEKFVNWQKDKCIDAVPTCLKRINVLAHSMGNRVFRGTMARWGEYNRCGEIPLLFRNSFLVAADIDNESLEPCNRGKYICDASRNVTVYFAADDFALRASKIANDGNLLNRNATRRMGHSGPEDPCDVPRNVYTIDCDDVNNLYDDPLGHTYFLTDGKGRPGLVFQHILNSLLTGRVEVDDPTARTKVIR